MALTGGGDEPVTTMTPSAPTTTHRRTDDRADDRADAHRAVECRPTSRPRRPTADSGAQPASAIDLGNGVRLTPASGWQVRASRRGPRSWPTGGTCSSGIVAQLPAEQQPGADLRRLPPRHRQGVHQRQVRGPQGGGSGHQEARRRDLPGAGDGRPTVATRSRCPSSRWSRSGTDGLTVRRHRSTSPELRHPAARQGLQRDGELDAEGPGRRRLAHATSSHGDAPDRSSLIAR